MRLRGKTKVKENLYDMRNRMEQVLRKPLRNHNHVEDRLRDTYWLSQDIELALEEGVCGWNDEALMSEINCMFRESHARIDKARASHKIYRKAERDARRRILQGADTSATNDYVLFGYSRNYVVDPALLALAAKPLPAELAGATVSHCQLVQAPRWVYDCIVSAIEESNWTDSKHLYTPCVPLPVPSKLPLFKHMLEMMELDRAYEATHVLL